MKSQKRVRDRTDEGDDLKTIPFEADYNRFSSILFQEDWTFSPYRDLSLLTESNPYASSQVDVMVLLSKVATRPNPQFKLGIVDMSCPFTVTDPTLPDNPIIYASEAFENLTKYSNREIVGRNCRFLQSPSGSVKQGSKREHCDTNTARHMRRCLDDETECQVVILNYTKTGVPFLNLVTMVPVTLGENENKKTFFVGFQCDANAKLLPQLTRFSSSSEEFSTPESDSSFTPDSGPFRGLMEEDEVKERRKNKGLQEEEEEEEEEEENYVPDTVPNNAIEHVSQLSIEGKYTYVSPNCSILLEFSEDKMLGQMLVDFVHPEDVPTIMEMMNSVKTTPKRRRVDSKQIIRFKTKRNIYLPLESRFETFINPISKQRQILLYVNQIPSDD